MGLHVFALLVMRSSLLPPHSPLVPQIFIFIGETLLSMNWAIVADILLVSRWAGPALGQILVGAGSGGLTCLELWPSSVPQTPAPDWLPSPASGGPVVQACPALPHHTSDLGLGGALTPSLPAVSCPPPSTWSSLRGAPRPRLSRSCCPTCWGTLGAPTSLAW